MEIALIVLWFVLCMIFGYILGSLNVSIKQYRYWILILILGAGYFIGLFIGMSI